MGEDANPHVEIPADVPEVQDQLGPELGAPDMDAARPPDPPKIKYWSPLEVYAKPTSISSRSSVCDESTTPKTSLVIRRRGWERSRFATRVGG